MGIGTSIDLQAQRAAVRLSTMVAAGIFVVATPVLSQGAMGAGAAPMAPQPRVVPAPSAPVAAPQTPMVAPNPTTPVAPQQTGTFTIRGNEQQLKEPVGTQGTRAVIGGTAIAAPKVLSPANDALIAGADSRAPIAFRWTPIVPRPRSRPPTG